MANYNLTSQQLKDTYQQLVQVSGSAIVDGTGSLVNAFDYPSNSAYTTFSSSVAVTLNSIVAGSGSADWTLITNKPAGLVSGSSQVIYSQITGVPSGILSSSAQIATNISGAFTSTSASLAAGIATNKSDITTKLATSTFTSYSSSVSTRLTTDETNIATNTSNIATQTSRVDSLVSATSSYAVLSSNNNFSGTQTFANIAVSGTASISHLQTVTGSAVIIGEEFIILNTAVPAARYAGMKVYDTGSTASTASFIFDGVTNDWFYEYSGSDATNYGVVLFGPEYNTIGTPSYPTSNVIQKGTGGHHLTGSNISDNGSQVSITGPVSASTYYGDGSNLTGVSSGLVAGTGTNSLRSALTSTPAVAAADLSIAIGNNVTVESLSTGMIAIGHNINGTFTNRDHSIAIGGGVILENDGFESIAIGSGSRGEDYSVSVGAGASSVGHSISIGKSAVAGGAGSIAIGSGSVSTATGTNPRTIAIGDKASSTGAGSIAIGYNTSVSGVRSIAIGPELTTVAGNNNVLIGYNGNTGGNSNCVAIGFEAVGGASNTTAIGNTAEANGVNSVAIGDAATYATNTVAVGIGIQASGDESIAIGTSHNTSNANSVAIGRRGDCIGEGSISIGSFTSVNGTNAIGLGANVTTTGNNSINIGNRFKFDGVASIFLSGSVTGSGGFSGNGSGLTNVTASFAAGNFEVSGQMFSPVFSGSVASSTSSVDFNNGNFAVLTLTSATHIANPSNIKSGTTYTLIINSGSLAATYGTSFKFAGGTKPTLSNGVDIVTMVSDGSRLFATGLANFS